MNSHTKKPVGRILAAILIGSIAMAAGIWSAQRLLQDMQPVASDLDATRFPVAREIGNFSLLDHTGETFDNSNLRGKWSFMFFGYTHCPDVCPTTLSILNGVANLLEASGTPASFLFVSVDPERDTPGQMAGFVRYFNEQFIGVTGTTESIGQFTDMLGIMHMKGGDSDSASGYLVDHTASILLFDPDGRFHAVFSPPFTVDTISSDFNRIREIYR